MIIMAKVNIVQQDLHPFRGAGLFFATYATGIPTYAKTIEAMPAL